MWAVPRYFLRAAYGVLLIIMIGVSTGTLAIDKQFIGVLAAFSLETISMNLALHNLRYCHSFVDYLLQQ